MLAALAALALGVGYLLSSSLQSTPNAAGPINLISVPPGATVLVNGAEHSETTPTTVVPAPSENVQRSTRVTLQLDGYGDWTYTHPPGGAAVQGGRIIACDTICRLARRRQEHQCASGGAPAVRLQFRSRVSRLARLSQLRSPRPDTPATARPLLLRQAQTLTR